jgi:membrane protein YqaA with SNARE-associated domain
MFFEYLLVFLGSLLVDIVPVPLPPAFTVMIFLQIRYDLNIWWVIIIGVAGSIIGRYILSRYIPYLSGKIFKQSKNEEVRFLGNKLKEKGWKSHLVIFLYSLMPLPTTPLFIAGGMARLRPMFIIPGFTLGKLISDFIAVFTGKYVAENSTGIIHGMISWKSVTGLLLGILLIVALLFIDWTTLLLKKKLVLKFNIWNR